MAEQTEHPTPRTLWQILALSHDELEQVDLVEVNLAVAREIPALRNIDIPRYQRIVNDWTQEFHERLPQMERMFKATPWKWKSDIRFFRVGMLQGFLGQEIGLHYIDEHKVATEVRYTDPSDLFLNGLIDKKKGTCGNMPTLHVAICRRLGWSVSLACAKSHFLSRFDDGEVIHNIEATTNHPGSFCSEEDSFYITRYALPKRAIECGSDLRKLTMREMMGAFLGLRGRHYCDVGNLLDADTSFALSRVLFPRHRRSYIGAIAPMLRRGSTLFDSDELGHPRSLFEDLAPMFAPEVYSSFSPQLTPIVQCVVAPPVHHSTTLIMQPILAPQDIQNTHRKGASL